jgi:hypothetical protein
LRKYVQKRVPVVPVKILCCEPNEEALCAGKDVYYLLEGYKEFIETHGEMSVGALASLHGAQSEMVPSSLYRGDRRYVFNLVPEKELALQQVYFVEQTKLLFEELRPDFVFMMGGGNLSRNAVYLVGERLGIPCYRILNTSYLNPNRKGVRYWFSTNNFCRLSNREKDRFRYSEAEVRKHASELITSIEKTIYRLDRQARTVARKKRVSLETSAVFRDLKTVMITRNVGLSKKRQSWARLNSLKNHILNNRLATDPREIPKPFFLFPLNVPEDAQLVLRAPHLRDLLSICEQVANVLPYGHTLAIKEHPGHPGMIDYYRLKTVLRYHRNMVFVRAEEKLWDLLGETSALIAVNSTAAIEALVRNIPVVTVGEAFYKGTGLTYDVEYPLHLQRVLSEVISDPMRDARAEMLLSTLCSILQETVPEPGVIEAEENYLDVIAEGILRKTRENG